MRLVVFSDSHRNYSALHGIVLSQPEAEVFIHLGDGEREFEELRLAFPEKAMYAAPGNNDWASRRERIGVITCAGKRVFFTHGHLHGVKAGLDAFLREARNYGADIALYGHTHIAHTSYADGLYILNPGSVSFPQAGPPSYGVVDITAAEIAARIVPLERRRKPGPP